MAIISLPTGVFGQPATPDVVQEIRAEASKETNEPGGRPLPLGSHWTSNNRETGFNAVGYQQGLIEEGHHLIPTLALPRFGKSLPNREIELVQTYAAWDIPISVNGGNWHTRLKQDRWGSLPDEQNPLLLQSNGHGGTDIKHSKVDPLGPTQPWTEAGQSLIQDSPGFAQLQQLYPDPSRVILLDNNETSRLNFRDANDSLRYTREYGTDTSKEQKRRVIGNGYAERFGYLLDGVKSSLSPNWQDAVKLVGYTGDTGTASFGPTAYGRFGGWSNYSTATYGDGNIDRSHLPWDGASISYYTPPYTAARDYRVFSPQIQWQNVPFMLDDALQDTPEFWLEQSVWEGTWGTNPVYDDKGDKIETYLAHGQTYNNARYAGYAQYGMWLTTPRVVRQFRGSAVYRDDFPGRFEALLENVDRVYESDILRRFWRKSALVANTQSTNPYDQALIGELSDQPRWFLLESDANTDFDHDDIYSTINVYSLARVLGDDGDREWLLYAYAPRGDEKDVTITVPGFGDVVVDATVGGSFYRIDEASGQVAPVTIPEPASLGLMGLGSGLMMLPRRRRGSEA